MMSMGSRRLTVALRTSPARWLAYSREDGGVTLGLADLLEDDLLGHLGGDASKGSRVFVEAEFAADLDLGGEFACTLECHLVDVVLDLLLRLSTTVL